MSGLPKSQRLIFRVTLVSLFPISQTTLFVSVSLALSERDSVFNGRYLYRKSKPALMARRFESCMQREIELMTSVSIFGQYSLSRSFASFSLILVLLAISCYSFTNYSTYSRFFLESIVVSFQKFSSSSFYYAYSVPFPSFILKNFKPATLQLAERKIATQIAYETNSCPIS